MKNYLAILLLFLLVSCGGSDDFTVDGEVENLGDRMIQMTYWDGHGFQQTTSRSVAGKFTLKGVSADPTIVEIRVQEGEPILQFIAENGDHIRFKMDFKAPGKVEIKGNKASRAYGEWLSENADLLKRRDQRGINAAVARYIAENPESMASTLLLMTRFYMPGNEMAADSLLSKIAPEARPSSLIENIASAVAEQVSADARASLLPMNLYAAGDSIYRYRPDDHSWTLLVFSDPSKLDSITGKLRSLRAERKRSSLEILEISLTTDSLIWRRNIATDSARWVQTWLPGSAASAPVRRLAVPRVPFFIVADSTGEQHYRGSSITDALKALR